MKKYVGYLLGRCIEDGDCLIYTGSLVNGIPRYSVKQNGITKTVQPRRVIWESKHGPIKHGMRVTTTCGNQACLAHLELVSCGEIVSRVAQRPEVRARRKVAAMAARERSRLLTDEQVRYIRSTPTTHAAMAAQMGVSMSTIAHVRRGERYRDYSNPFAGLLR